MTSPQIINPFQIESEAERYHKYRPRYHHIPFQAIRDLLGYDFESALDVACGTGHSTMALAKYSRKTVGCDMSESMLSVARRSFDIDFIQAQAEQLPFDDSCFDVLNISMAFHWVDQRRFLNEAKRVLKNDGYLIVDSYGFSGRISQNVEKQKRHDELFSNALVPAARGSAYPTDELIANSGLEFVKEIKYEHQVSLGAHEFTNLLMTWSNFQILQEAQKVSIAAEMTRLYDEIFGGKALNLPFCGKALLYHSR